MAPNGPRRGLCMRVLLLCATAAVGAALAIATGSGGSAKSNQGSSSGIVSAAAASLTSEAAIQPNEAARLAKQASFGPTPELINAIVAKQSAAAWLDDQFSLSSSSYADIASKPVVRTFCEGKTGSDLSICTRDNFGPVPMQMRFYANAIGKNDQLRQRVAFALSQIVVASEVEVHNTVGLATFNQILLSNAFGNYRDILKAVTLNGYMGDYLDMADSNKAQPNENYAREFMQLFSVGTVLLNSDGTPQLDSTGAPTPAYNNTDVKEVARALTGWTFKRLNGAALTDWDNRDLSQPMVQYPAWFDAGAKTFLGKTVPANVSQQANVDAVVDAVFYHPNTGPFISKRLIQQLTLANPTPAYVGRVSAVFANNGAGVRGDLKAVVRAIYLDPEARGASQLPGKVKEPVLLTTSLARAIGFATDGYAFMGRDYLMGQAPFRAPSVFNYYSYDFPLPQNPGAISPVSKLITTSNTVARHNFIYDWTVGGDATRVEFAVQGNIVGSIGSTPDWSTWEANGIDDAKTVDRIDLVMLNGTMSSAQRQALLTAMSQIKSGDITLQARKRAQVALYIVASSPLFQVDR
jgi:uncharacterized protein (DUF1800 family)